MKTVISQTKAAARLGVHRDTIRAAVRTGKIEGVFSKLNPSRIVGVTVESIERVEKKFEQANA